MADATYQPEVYREQGGDRLVVASEGSADIESGGAINVESGGAIAVESGAESDFESGALLKQSGVAVPTAITFVAAAGGANVCEVTITVTDNAGNALATAWPLAIWLSDDAEGEGLTGTSASGTVQAKAASGSDLTELTAKKHLSAVALATGIYTLEITDDQKTTFYVAAAVLGGGARGVSAILATGDYGA